MKELVHLPPAEAGGNFSHETSGDTQKAVLLYKTKILRFSLFPDDNVLLSCQPSLYQKYQEGIMRIAFVLFEELL